jgi:DNA end-binding protein Ku
MRSIWSGAISFGLVNIPVKLYSASGENRLDFDMLAQPDLSRVKYKKVAATDGREVENSDIVKGYEFEKGQYVLLDDEDFEKANAKKTKAIELINFVKEDEIDPIYYEKPYYLEPDKNAAKPYALLREALRESQKIGIAKYVLRNREHLAALKTVGDVILLNQMRYYQDLRDFHDLELPSVDNLSKQELQMANLLIDQLTQPFEPEQYKDTYINELKRVIEQKAAGKPIEPRENAPEPTRVDDLMATLKASLKAMPSSSNRPPVKNEEKKRRTKTKKSA